MGGSSVLRNSVSVLGLGHGGEDCHSGGSGNLAEHFDCYRIERGGIFTGTFDERESGLNVVCYCTAGATVNEWTS